MSLHTVSVEWLLARAAVRQTGLLHVVSRRDSGALNPICGARTISSEKIDERHHLDDVATLCEGCGTIAASIGGTVRDGVALLLGLSDAATTTRLLDIPVDAVAARQDHVRQTPGAGLEELVDSIAERGVVTPLIVRRHGRRYEIIDGARRLYAAAVAGLSTVPAVVRDATDGEVLLDGLVANIHRTDLNPIDRANAYRRALEQLQVTQAELAHLVAVSQPQIANTLRLLALPTEVQDLVASGAVGAAHARELLKLDDDAARVALAAQIAAQGLTVKETAARRAAATPPTATDFSQLLEALRDARLLVSPRAGGRARITIDVEEADVPRVLEQFGKSPAVAA